MKTVGRLTGAAYGIHLADQMALVSVPLAAALIFDASAPVIGLLVACQSMAHLLGSIPFGVLVDRVQQRTLAISATLVSLIGFSGAAIAALSGSLVWFGLCVTCAGFGVVLFTLTTLSILPKVVGAADLATANAGIELPRAINSFAVPLCIGIFISGATSLWIFPGAALAAGMALLFALGLPAFEMAKKSDGSPVLTRIVEGGKFVIRQDLLRAISVCAIFWNFAFSALLVTMVPFVRDVMGAKAGVFGVALAAFGLGAIGGTWISKRFAGRIAPNFALLFGPGSSFLAAMALWMIPQGGPILAIYAAFFLLGFGPSMWLIAQNSVRQIVSPRAMLGRVNAVIQTTIYGIRPVAALIAGAVVGATSPETGLGLVVGGFGLSFLAATLSGLRHITRYDDLKQMHAA